MKLRKKITAIFLGLALLGVVAGFCDSWISSVNAAGNSDTMYNMMNNSGVEYTKSFANTLRMVSTGPMSDALSPCCVDRHAATPSLETFKFTAGAKLAYLNNIANTTNNTAFLENKLQGYSDSSPPAPDVLASVLKRE